MPLAGSPLRTSGPVLINTRPASSFVMAFTIRTQLNQQLGCAGHLLAMMALDPSITFTGAAVKPATVPAPKPAAPSKPSITNPGKGSIGDFIVSIFNAIFRRK